MEITHFGHACLLADTGQARLLIDPGTMSSGFEELTDLDAVLVTHEHADHVDVPRVMALLAGNPRARLVVDEVTAALFSSSATVLTVAHPGERVTVGGVRVDVLGGVHAPVYGDIPGCPNLAYLVGEGELLHPGDAFVVPPTPVQTLAVPIDGPWLKLSEAIDYVHAVRPERVVPIHEGELTDVAKYVGLLTHLVPASTVVTRLG